LWAAIAIVAGAFLARSIVLRGGDFSLDLPSDAIVLVVLVVALALVAWSRHLQGRDGNSHDEDDDD
jgi:uncharacterized membrane protein